MAVITTVDQLKAAVGGAVNADIVMASISVAIDDATEAVRPMLGDAVLARCDGGSPTANATLLALVRRAVGHLALEKYSRVGSVQMGEAGMMRVETETHRGAYKYQENAYRRQMLDTGWEALERALLWLLRDGGADGAAWSGAAKSRHTALAVWGAAAWRQVDSTAMTRGTYEVVRGIVEETEEYLLKGFLPRAFVEGLIVKLHAGTLTTTEAELMRWMQKGVCHFARETAMMRHVVQMEGGSVVSRELLGDQGTVKESIPSAANLRMVYTDAKVWSVRAMERVRELVTVSAFPSAWHTDAGGSSTAADAWGKNLTEAETTAAETQAALKAVMRW